jgi:hypothetical protein
MCAKRTSPVQITSSEFNFQFLNIDGFQLGGSNPFLQLRQSEPAASRAETMRNNFCCSG